MEKLKLNDYAHVDVALDHLWQVVDNDDTDVDQFYLLTTAIELLCYLSGRRHGCVTVPVRDDEQANRFLNKSFSPCASHIRTADHVSAK